MKNFNHKEDGVSTVGGVLCMLLTALVISTFLISLFLQNTNSGTSINAINLPNGMNTYSSAQNFIDCSINSSTWSKNIQSKWFDVCGIGEVLSWVMSPRIGYLLLQNEVPDNNGNYDNTYIINNSVQQPYYIELRYTGSSDQNDIYIDDTGFHIPNYVLGNPLAGVIYTSGDNYFYSYAGADLISNPTIRTVYNDNTPSVSFYFNENLLFTTTNLNKNGINPLNFFTHYMGGVGSYTTGFTLQNYQTQNTISTTPDNLLGSIVNFVSTYLSLLVFALPASLDPFGIANWIYRLLEGCCVVAFVVLLRG